MEDSAKYLIHADVAADGVVERTDVVGAVFGQTEGLLGAELDIRDLQESAKLGRFDVSIDSEGGRSFGEMTIGSNLDRVETAILAAALETIDRVGPCRATIRVRRIEDVRAAKRREIVDRAQELLASGFDEGAVGGDELVESVREELRVADVTEYEGLPAGPRVADGDAVIVVEGRADVVRLLRYGIKNAIAVEGTDVPDAVVELTRGRTSTAFVDGDRGGNLVLAELVQRGDVDYVARAPDGRSVEDLPREAVLAALREKVPAGAAVGEGGDVPDVDDGTTTADADDESTTAIGDDDADAVSGDVTADDEPTDPSRIAEDRTADAITDGATTVDALARREQPAAEESDGTLATQEPDDGEPGAGADAEPGRDAGDGEAVAGAGAAADAGAVSDAEPASAADESAESVAADEDTSADVAAAAVGATVDDRDGGGTEAAGGAPERAVADPSTLAERIRAVTDDTGTICLLDDSGAVLYEAPAADAVTALAEAEPVPRTAILDGTVSQALLDVAAQRGVGTVVGSALGEFTKQPAAVRVHAATELLE